MAKNPKLTLAQYKAFKNKVFPIMSRHIGPGNGIGMGELYRLVTGENWKNRINDTRLIRRVITDLRSEGVRICSDVTNGYYLAQTDDDFNKHCDRLRRAAIKKLELESKMRGVTVNELIGQIAMELRGGQHNEPQKI